MPKPTCVPCLKFMRPKETTTDKTVNSHGYHDVDQSAPRRPNERIVVLLGDSYVEPVEQTPQRFSPARLLPNRVRERSFIHDAPLP